MYRLNLETINPHGIRKPISEIMKSVENPVWYEKDQIETNWKKSNKDEEEFGDER